MAQSEDVATVGKEINLAHASVNRPAASQLRDIAGRWVFTLTTKGGEMTFACETEELRTSWMQHLTRAAQMEVKQVRFAEPSQISDRSSVNSGPCVPALPLRLEEEGEMVCNAAEQGRGRLRRQQKPTCDTETARERARQSPPPATRPPSPPGRQGGRMEKRRIRGQADMEQNSKGERHDATQMYPSEAPKPAVVDPSDEPMFEQEHEYGKTQCFGKEESVDGSMIEGNSSMPNLKETVSAQESGGEVAGSNWVISQLRPDAHPVVDAISPPSNPPARQLPPFPSAQTAVGPLNGDGDSERDSMASVMIPTTDDEGEEATEDAKRLKGFLPREFSLTGRPAPPPPQKIELSHDPSGWKRVKCEVCCSSHLAIRL